MKVCSLWEISCQLSVCMSASFSVFLAQFSVCEHVDAINADFSIIYVYVCVCEGVCSKHMMQFLAHIQYLLIHIRCVFFCVCAAV